MLRNRLLKKLEQVVAREVFSHIFGLHFTKNKLFSFIFVNDFWLANKLC